jgi:hypothetical protein
MISSEDLTERLVEWAREVLPELNGGYAYLPSSKEQALPDVVVDITRTYIDADAADGFAEIRIQQRAVRVWEVEMSFMVDNSDPEQASATLRSWYDRLLDGWLASRTLGGRVPFTSPYPSIDSSSPFVEYEDGTKGREITMQVAVGDLVEAD